MKIVMILNASSPLRDKNISVCNAFIEQLEGQQELEAWLIHPSQTDERSESFFTLAVPKITWVFVAEVYDAPSIGSGIATLYEQKKPDILLFEGSLWGDEQAALLAAHLHSDAALGIHNLHITEDGTLEIQRMVYANNLDACIVLREKPYCLSLHRNKPSGEWPKREHEIDSIAIERDASTLPYVLSSEWISDEKDTGLASSPFVIAVGRAAGSPNEIAKLEKDCAYIDAALGVTRAVSMNGWINAHYLLGVSGQIISPRLCIVLGAAGAAAFMAGIEHSACIVAINTDPDALLFQRADIGILADYREIWNELLPLLSQS